jgi:O-antigen/teichoic acid export membrane protein
VREGEPTNPPAPESASTEARLPPAGRRGNLIALGLSQLAVFASALVVQAFLARFLGKETFGTYSFLLGVTALFSFIAHMNLRVLLARRVARAPETGAQTMGLGLVTTALLTFVAIGGVVGYAWFRDGRQVVVVAAAIAGLALGVRGLARVAEAVFQGQRRMGVMVRATVLGRSVLVIATIGLVLVGAGLPGVFAAQLLGTAVLLGVLVNRFKRTQADIPLGYPAREVVRLIKDARPFALDQLFGAIYLVSDLLILKEFHGDDEVGLYRAATILVLQLPVVAVILNKGIYPRMAWHMGDPDAAGEELAFAVRALLAVSLPVAIGGICVAGPLLVLIVGDQYAEATLAFIVLLGMVPFRFVNNATGNALSALDQQPARTRGIFYAAAFNVVANLVAIPRFGALGAAVTTLLTDMLLTGYLALRLVPSVRGVSVGNSVVVTLVPVLPMAAILLALPGWHVLLRILVGALVYAGFGYLSGAWRVGDLKRLRDI